MKSLPNGYLGFDQATREKILDDVVSDQRNYSVFGLDFYKYSDLDAKSLVVFPAILEALVAAATETSKQMAPFLFPDATKDVDSPFSRRIETGDGCFIIFDNPLQAFCFAVNFAVVLRMFNSGRIDLQVLDQVGELNARYCITMGNVYKFRDNFFGRPLIQCSRIMARDRLNRFCIDSNVHLWFMRTIHGIENVKNINEDFVEHSELRSLFTFDTTQKNFRFFDSIDNCVELKLSKSKEKNTELDIFAVFVEASLVQGKEKRSRMSISIGNMNTEGLGSA